MGKARNIADLLNSSGKIDSADIDSSAQFYQFKNRIINGDCRIDQRNAGASVTPANGGFSLDRWTFSLSQASKLTAQQNAGSVTPPVGFSNYLGLTSSSAYSVTSSDYFNVMQTIEAFNTSDLGWGTANAQTITLSFWVRSSLTGTFGGSLRTYNGYNTSYPFTYTISSANTWEQKSIIIAGPTTGTWNSSGNSGSIVVGFGLGAGSTFSGTAGAWAAGNFISTTGATSVVGTNGATFYITGVQLEKGSTATSFDYRPYGTELQLCQRYCMAYGGTSNNETVGYGFGISTGTVEIVTALPVPMRALPSMSVSGSFQISDASTAFVIFVLSLVSGQTGNQQVTLRATSSGLTQFRPYRIEANGTSAKLLITAEL